MAKQVPLVDYLVLGDEPYLLANECTACGLCEPYVRLMLTDGRTSFRVLTAQSPSTQSPRD